MKVFIPKTVDEAVSLIQEHFSDESVLGCDTETYGLHNVTPFSIIIGAGDKTIYINLNKVPDIDGKLLPSIPAVYGEHIKCGLNDIEGVKEYYQDIKDGVSLVPVFDVMKGKTLVFHNAQFDIKMLRALDKDIIKSIEVNDIRIFCTMQFYVKYIKPGKYIKLKALGEVLGTASKKSDAVQEWFDKNPVYNYKFYRVPVKTIVEYASLDVLTTYEIYCKMIDKITEVRNAEGDVRYAYEISSR